MFRTRSVVSLAFLLLAGAPALAQQKPPTSFVAANPNYYGRGRGGSPITHVVIHTIEGSAGSAMNTFRYGSRKVSAHYIVDFDGRITQMVEDRHTAWHAGRYNRHSIGIEHAGFAGRNKWTIEQYRASARLTRWLCDTYGIPKDRSHIVGHKEVPGATHGDPGRFFDWTLYMRLVRGEGGATTGGGTLGSTPDPVVTSPGTGATTTPGTGTTTAPVTAALEVEPLRPQAGEVIGTDDVGADRASLTVRWASEGRPQVGARVWLEEVGGDARYDSGHLAGAGEQHVVRLALAHGRSYRWHVRVWDGATSVETPWVTFRTDFTRGPVQVLSPVEGETVHSSPLLRWKSGSPQVSYRVWIDDDASHASVLADSKELNGAQGYHALKMRLQPGRTYHWRVMSYDGRGNQSFSPWTSFRTSPTYQHIAKGGELTVVALSPIGGALLPAAERPVLRWGFHSSSDQRGFRVQLDDMSDENGVLVDDKSATNHAGYRPAQALAPGSYRWRVRVWDARGSATTEWQSFVLVPESPGLSGAIPGF